MTNINPGGGDVEAFALNPLDSPEAFLLIATGQQPGWSQVFGGPTGVARHCVYLQGQLQEISRQLAHLRAAAIHEELAHDTGITVARRHGIKPQVISRISKEPATRIESW